jgi:SAM-dependent methyltransferase
MPTTADELFLLTFPRVLEFSYLNTLRRMLADCRSCLDIGCGGWSPTRHLRFEHSVGVDGHTPLLDEARKNRTHTDFVFARAQEIGEQFAAGQFDCCVALDLIEHLTKGDGLKLIRDMERIAAKKIRIFTPSGFLSQRSRDGDLQEHLSGWSADEMRSLGFEVIGMHGARSLRGEEHRHRFRPYALSGVVSAVSHYAYTRRHPEKAAAILCVKSAVQATALRRSSNR